MLSLKKIKKYLASLGICTLLITAVPTVTFAEITPNDEALATEIVSALERTIQSNFTANAQLTFSAKGSDDDFSHFDVKYDSGLISAQKNKNVFSVSTNNETFSVNIEKNADARPDEGDFLFPMNFSGKYAGSFLADFDRLNFAGKFSYTDFVVSGNKKLENVIIGALEFVEPVENKWIELNFETLHREFPEILDDYEETQSEISDYLTTEGIEEFEDILLAGVEDGVITLKKSGNTYTISSENPLALMVIGGKSPVITMTVNSKQVITDFSFVSDFDVTMSGSEEISGNFIFQSHFTYGSQKIVWPTFQKNDWELTKVVRMFMEFVQAENDFAKIENQFWYDLESNSEGDFGLELSLDILRNNNLAGESYLMRYADLDAPLGAGDILFLARKSGIELSDWEKDEVRDTFSFEEKDDYYYYNDDVSKGELILGLFVDEAYEYQPWDVEIDEDIVYQLETKKDFIIFLSNALVADNGGL